MKMVRQGDVLLARADAKESELEPCPIDPRGLVLAEGETSGHFHAVFGNGAKLMRYKADPERVVVVVGDDGASVRVVGGGSGGVDRHAPIDLAPGTYERRIQRAWDSANASRQVQD